MKQKKLSLADRADFFYHLARLSQVGGSVNMWIKTWTPKSSAAEAVRRKILFYLNQNETLAGALKRVGAFEDFETALMKLAEETGRIPQITNLLAESRENQLKLQKQMKSQLVMPAIELLASFFAIAIVIYFVLPKFESFLLQANMMEKMPAFSKEVFRIANFLKIWGPLLLVGLVAGIVAFYRQIKANYMILLKVPYFSALVKSRFYSILFLYLNVMVEAGIPFPKCFALMAQSFKNDPLIERVAIRIANILATTGSGLAYAMGIVHKNTPVFTQEVLSLIDLGERYGQINKIAQRAFKMYYEDYERALNNLVKLAMPITLMIVAFLVVGLILGVMVPTFQMAFTFMGGGA